MNTRTRGIHTRLVHAGPRRPHGAVTVPIYQTSTFAFRNAQHGAALLRRRGRRLHLHAPRQPDDPRAGGVRGRTGGRAAAASPPARAWARSSTVYMALLGQGAHMVSTASVYGPSRGLVEKHLSRFGVDGHVRGHDRPGERAAGPAAEHQAGLRRDALEPGHAGHRHPRPWPRSPTPTAACWSVDNTFASPLPAAAARPGRRRRAALGDQVHQRPRRRGGRASWSRKTEELDRRLRPADDRAGLQHGPAPGLPGLPRPEDAGPAHRARPGRRARDRRAGSRRGPRWTGCATSGCRPTPSTSWRSGRCAAPAP